MVSVPIGLCMSTGLLMKSWKELELGPPRSLKLFLIQLSSEQAALYCFVSENMVHGRCYYISIIVSPLVFNSFLCWVEKDAYVLCRVFHKNNIGPPNGQRYAPFIEEEWDDSSALIPGAEPVNEATAIRRPLIEGNGHVGCFEGTNGVQDTQSINKAPLDVNKLPIETQNLLAVCKRESMAEYPSPERDNSKTMDEYPSPQTDNPKPFSLIYKRRRHNLNTSHSNAPEHSARNSQDPCSSIITTAATTLPATTTTTTASASTRKHFLSALVEFSLLESLEPKESPSTRVPQFDPSTLDAPVPPSCLKFIQQLQDEVRKLSVERETMKFEIMSAQAMINILQSRIDALNKENEELKRGN
ncbi:NAC domain containing protein 52-like isoform X3 [Prosopis cineraria]|uniref:NAC domain containing protein 52-like isoform X3 n=1 Tax=Prosopis cineraria TaxID=364024 RepID=UPI00240F9335|nr:NAC domain containing protein 52-like isoform X3 [Prosopis cineraria]